MKKFSIAVCAILGTTACSTKTVNQSLSSASAVDSCRVSSSVTYQRMADSLMRDLHIIVSNPVIEISRGDSVTVKLSGRSLALSRSTVAVRGRETVAHAIDSVRLARSDSVETVVTQKPTSGHSWSWTWAVMGLLCAAFVGWRVSRL
jgi:hypothetical protein